MILVLTAPSDVHADRVIDALEHRGASPVRFDPADYPSRATISFWAGPGALPITRLERAGSNEVRLDDTAAIWYRRPGRPRPHDCVSMTAATDVTEQSQAFLDDLWAVLGAKWLPAPPGNLALISKLRVLRVAHALGFEIPDTLVTNSPSAFLEFYRRHEGQIVSKLLGRSPVNSADSRYVRYTEVVETWEASEPASVSLCPVIFQENVSKDVELRVTLVGSRIFAASIASQRTSHTRTDWRRYDHRNTPVVPFELPTEIGERLLRLREELMLRFATIDLILRPDGRVVFLEVNPNGQYLWIEDSTGLPISAAVADELLEMAGTGSR